MADPLWAVYMVRTSRGSLYTGISTDPVRRVYEHNHTKKGAKALRGQRPVRLVWQHPVLLDKGDALRLEAKIKRMTKAAKEKLVG